MSTQYTFKSRLYSKRKKVIGGGGGGGCVCGKGWGVGCELEARDADEEFSLSNVCQEI